MNEFLKFINNLTKEFPLHVLIEYNKTCDWNIYIYKKGCAKDYPNSKHRGEDAVLCNVESCDMELAFAMAQVEVKEWLSDNCGGY
jgi:hypothetical protein